MTTNSIPDTIAALNTQHSLPAVFRFILMSRVQRAAQMGDVNAQRFVQLCELSTELAAKH